MSHLAVTKRPYQPYDFQAYEQYLAQKAKEDANNEHQARRKAVPIEFGTEYGTLLEQQLHEHGETRRMELQSRGRPHPAKNIYVPAFPHKTEQKMMQGKGRPPQPIAPDTLAQTLLQQQAEKVERDRQEVEARKQPSRWPFPRIRGTEVPLFPTRGKPSPPLSKQEYAATLKALIAVKHNNLKEDEVLEAVSTPGGSRVGITGAQALALAVPNHMLRSYPGRVGIQTNLYHSVIANAAYPPKTPEKPLRGRAHPPTPGNYHRVVFSTDSVIEKVRSMIKARGDQSFNAIKRSFKVMDTDGSGILSPVEFKWGIFEFGLQLSDTELSQLMKAFDTNGDGAISLTEFVSRVRGGMPEKRVALVEMAFKVLDQDGSGVVTIADVASTYNVDMHPKVVSGELTKEQALSTFLNGWDPTPDGKLTRKDFVEYYANLSAAIDNDDYFELMIRNAWHISGGTGWAANSSCLRVLVTYHDNTEEVLEIANDLGLDPRNAAAVRERLVRQGVHNIKRVSVSDGSSY